MIKTTHDPMHFKRMEQRAKSRTSRRMSASSKVNISRNRRGKAGLSASQYDDSAYNKI